MKILGHRILVTRIDEPEVKEGEFQKVEVQDSFVCKGKVGQIGEETVYSTISTPLNLIKIGDIVLFKKYSPDTQEIEDEGVKKKIIVIDDVLAIL